MAIVRSVDAVRCGAVRRGLVNAGTLLLLVHDGAGVVWERPGAQSLRRESCLDSRNIEKAHLFYVKEPKLFRSPTSFRLVRETHLSIPHSPGCHRKAVQESPSKRLPDTARSCRATLTASSKIWCGSWCGEVWVQDLWSACGRGFQSAAAGCRGPARVQHSKCI